MAEIRLSKLIKQFNIGLDTLVDFLNSKGAGIDNPNPNMKVSDEYLSELHKKFGKDLELKEAAEKVDVKLTEILDKASRKSGDEDDFEPEKVMVIKSNNLSRSVEAEPEPVVAEPEPEPVVEPEPEPVVEVEPEPVVEPEPEPVAEAEPEPVAVEPEPVAETKAEEPQEPQQEQETPATTPAETPASPVSPELKVLGKIDLSQFDPKKGKKRERIKAGGSQKVDVTKVQADKTP